MPCALRKGSTGAPPAAAPPLPPAPGSPLTAEPGEPGRLLGLDVVTPGRPNGPSPPAAAVCWRKAACAAWAAAGWFRAMNWAAIGLRPGGPGGPPNPLPNGDLSKRGSEK